MVEHTNYYKEKPKTYLPEVKFFLPDVLDGVSFPDTEESEFCANVGVEQPFDFAADFDLLDIELLARLELDSLLWLDAAFSVGAEAQVNVWLDTENLDTEKKFGDNADFERGDFV